jgi:electron transport complex protein RnfB
VDAIIGAPRFLHTVAAQLCTGCELCIAPCPVDCISMVDLNPAAVPEGAPSASENRERFQAHEARVQRRATERATLLESRKKMAPAADPHSP